MTVFELMGWGLVLLETESDDSGAYLPLLLCLSGFIFYAVMYARYRNADKRHSHESETASETRGVQGYDQLVERRTGLSNASMHGANDSEIEGALNSGGDALEMLKRQLPGA